MKQSSKTETELLDFDRTKIRSVKESAKHLGISERQLWRVIHDKEIESVKLGTNRRGITQGALVDFINERTVPKFNPNDAAKNILAG